MNVAIVTGASSGIGLELCKQLSKNPNYFSKKQDRSQCIDEIWLIARSVSKLERLASQIPIKTQVIPLDLADKKDLDRYEAKIMEEKPKVTLLVNNAGYGKFGPFDTMPMTDSLGMMDVNCYAVVALTRLTLPYMQADSRIIQIASSASFLPMPDMSIYCATKSFVVSFSTSLRTELVSRGISVTCVMPGPVSTEFFTVASEYKKVDLVGKKLLFAKPDAVVSKILKDAKNRSASSVYGFYIKIFRVLCKILPHRFLIVVWKKFNKKG